MYNEEPMQEGPRLDSMPERELPMTESVAKQYRPSKQEALREYEINIRFLSRGCIVKVGCKEIAFEDFSRAMAEINEYVAGDTYEVQKKWRKLLD
jgi:hypothetical protein